MRKLRAWFLRLGGLFNKERRDKELAEEIESHVQMHIEDNLRSGMSAIEARRNALIKLGGIELTKEQYRDRRGIRAVETLLRDFRYGLRILRKSPGFTAVAVLTLALGIGANTAIFSVVDGVLVRPLPYGDPNRLVVVWETNQSRGVPKTDVAPPNLFDWQEQTDIFEAIGGYTPADVTLTYGGEAEQVPAARISVDLFRVLHTSPSLGRGFASSDGGEDAPRIVLLSHGLWQRRFGSETRIIGRTVILDGHLHQVIGVMPAHFSFPPLIGPKQSNVLGSGELWVPLKNTQMARNRRAHYLRVIGRLKRDVTADRAREELSIVAGRLALQYPESNTGWSVRVVPLVDEATGDIRPALMILFTAVGFVLLLACANVAHLLLMRSVGRRREMAVRVSLGAGRLHLARQLFTESLLLAALAGVVGALLASWAVGLIRQAGPSTLPRLDQVSVDFRALTFTAACAILSAIVFSLIPIKQAVHIHEHEWLRERASGGSGRAAYRMHATLIAGEAAIAVMLVIVAALLIESFLRLRGVDPGFAADRVLTFRVALPAAIYRNWQQRATFVEQTLDRLAAMPGIDSVGAIDAIPLDNDRQGTSFTIEGKSPVSREERIPINFAFVTPGYFEAMGVRIARGRLFETRDRKAAEPVVIINEALARRFFSGEDSIGRRIRTGFEAESRRIIGIVADERHESLRQEAGPAVYLPYLQAGWGGTLTFAVRATLDSPSTAVSVRHTIRALDAGVAVFRLRTMNQIVSESVANSRFSTIVLGVFAGVALLLAGIGAYGVTSYSVTQRTSEIGIRIAFGAKPRDILAAVLLKNMLLAGAGILAGLAASLAFGSVLSSMLYGVTATSIPTYILAAAVVAGASFAACYLPARRAAIVDPMVALRHE